MPTSPDRNGFRQEKDSIGIKEIPADVYYGVQTARAVENYPISGMRAHPTLTTGYGLLAISMLPSLADQVWKRTAFAQERPWSRSPT